VDYWIGLDFLSSFHFKNPIFQPFWIFGVGFGWNVQSSIQSKIQKKIDFLILDER
jgi:hypothetical protein